MLKLTYEISLQIAQAALQKGSELGEPFGRCGT